MPEEKVIDIYEVLTRLKEQLPDALKHQKDTVKLLQMMLEHGKDILAWLDKNYGTVPQVRSFINVNKATIGTLNERYLDSLNTTTQFLALWERFFALTLPRVPWVCPKCKNENDHWHMRCTNCGEPKDLWGDDFTKWV